MQLVVPVLVSTKLYSSYHIQKKIQTPFSKLLECAFPGPCFCLGPHLIHPLCSRLTSLFHILNHTKFFPHSGLGNAIPSACMLFPCLLRGWLLFVFKELQLKCCRFRLFFQYHTFILHTLVQFSITFVTNYNYIFVFCLFDSCLYFTLMCSHDTRRAWHLVGVL